MSFQHRQAAHCESGVISSLLTHHGLAISEPMAFGLANALAFAYIPVVKIGGQPLIAYRLPPKAIIKGLCRRLGVEVRFQKFKSPVEGANALDDLLAQGKMVGLQTSVYYLPYFPQEMRFHFNAHNLLVYGEQSGQYLVSDPVFEQPVTVAARDLNKARFVRGPLAPKGLLYTVESVPKHIDYARIITQAIGKNIKVMTGAPLPVIGVRGVMHLAKKIEKSRLDDTQQRLFLGHIVRMQEEIGTGGAGFRFIYASFLQEAGALLEDETLGEASQAMTEAGDLWRDFAVAVAKECKTSLPINNSQLADLLRLTATREQQVWQLLTQWYKRRR
ncbi:BtrH N-terminal domain-containing protein [Gilvimarinus chinensis]|uniref:BtrH N-terminal domain-containing protein n=1 Tax=Gilvimarinus chinensis TaxID=396005 RepID=UPI00037559A8|nr:BtrH N-terminal domain-containing protein [Gilvimarinus chinensis]